MVECNQQRKGTSAQVTRTGLKRRAFAAKPVELSSTSKSHMEEEGKNSFPCIFWCPPYKTMAHGHMQAKLINARRVKKRRSQGAAHTEKSAQKRPWGPLPRAALDSLTWQRFQDFNSGLLYQEHFCLTSTWSHKLVRKSSIISIIKNHPFIIIHKEFPNCGKQWDIL